MRRAVSALAFLLLCLSCIRPSSEESFIRIEDAPGGVFCFEASLADSSLTYDFALYTRLDAPHRQLSHLEGIPLKIDWISPTGVLYSEQQILPISGKGRRLMTTDLVVPYWTGVSPREFGLWKINVSPLARVPGFRGIGLIVTHSDGTR